MNQSKRCFGVKMTAARLNPASKWRRKGNYYKSKWLESGCQQAVRLFPGFSEKRRKYPVSFGSLAQNEKSVTEPLGGFRDVQLTYLQQLHSGTVFRRTEILNRQSWRRPGSHKLHQIKWPMSSDTQPWLGIFKPKDKQKLWTWFCV